MRRPLTFARNVVLLARTAVRHAGDDPMLLAVQTLRRLPDGVRQRVASTLADPGDSTRSVSRALGLYLADRPSEARAALEQAAPSGRLTKLVGAELQVAVGGEAPEGRDPHVPGTGRVASR